MSSCVRGPIEVNYLNQFEAELLFSSRGDAIVWKRSLNPVVLLKLIFDRVTDDEDQKPYPLQLRVGLGFQNETTRGEKDNRIQTILKQISIECKNPPPEDIVKFLLNNLERYYDIAGRSYQIISLISDRGQYGDVFKARDVKTGKIIAIKILRDARDQEHHVLSKLQSAGGHRNVVKFYGYGNLHEKIWIAMEYIQGEVAKEFVRHSTWTDELRAQYQEAIKFIEAKGVHWEGENVQENIMVMQTDSGLVIKIIDFGTLARG